MAQFTIILEDVKRVTGKGNINGRTPSWLDISNRRVDTIEAEDIDDAWTQARAKYYTGMEGRGTEDGQTQIFDVVAGLVDAPPLPPPPAPLSQVLEIEDASKSSGDTGRGDVLPDAVH